MEKIKLELTEKQLSALKSLVMLYNMNSYRKAIGGMIAVESKVCLSEDTDRALQRLNKKIH